MIRSARSEAADGITAIDDNYQHGRDIRGRSGSHAVIGGVALPNPASVALHEKFGMRKVAHFEEVGFKCGRWVDVAYWQRTL